MTDRTVVAITLGLGLIVGGIVLPLIINWLCDKWGWFR